MWGSKKLLDKPSHRNKIQKLGKWEVHVRTCYQKLFIHLIRMKQNKPKKSRCNSSLTRAQGQEQLIKHMLYEQIKKGKLKTNYLGSTNQMFHDSNWLCQYRTLHTIIWKNIKKLYWYKRMFASTRIITLSSNSQRKTTNLAGSIQSLWCGLTTLQNAIIFV